MLPLRVPRMKPHKHRGRGRFVEIKIVDQFNSHDIIFKERARTDDPDGVRRLLSNARLRGLEESVREEEANRRFLFGEDPPK